MTIFYKKLNLELDTDDWRFLNYLSHTYLSNVEALNSPANINQHKEYYTKPISGKIGQYKYYSIRKSNNDYSDRNIFKKIANLFKPGSNLNSFDVIYNSSQLSFVGDNLVPHKDKRKCAITIPLTTITSPISWYKATSPELSEQIGLSDRNTYSELASYDYGCTATIINTSIFHGTPDNISPRIFFQISIDNDIETAVDSLI